MDQEQFKEAYFKRMKKNKINPKEVVFRYLVYLPLVIVCVCIAFAAAYLYLRYTVPRYNSSISLLINSDKNGRGNTDALDQLVIYKNRANLANEVEILKSVTLMEKVVRDIGLNTQYVVEGNLKKSKVYVDLPIVYEPLTQKDTTIPYSITLNFNEQGQFMVAGQPGRWFGANDIVKGRNGDFRIRILNTAGIKPEYKYHIRWQPPQTTATSIAAGLNIRQLNKDASILKIDYVSEITQEGKDILNQLVKEYNLTSIENKNKVIDNTVKFIDGRLILLAGELGSVEQGLQNFKQRNEIIDIQSQGQAQYGDSKEAADKLAAQEIQLQVIEMINKYIANPQKRNSLVPSTLGIEDATLSELITEYNQLQIDREEKLKTMPEANPAVQLVNSQLEKIRTSLIENLANLKASGDVLRNRLYADYVTAKGQLRTIPAKEKELLEIARQQGIKEKLYLFLLQKREELAIAMASSTSNAASIDPAAASPAPVSPDRAATLQLALILGLLVPVGLIYLRVLFNDKITHRADIVNVSDMPIIGEIAHNKMADRKLVIGSNDRSIISEQFRVARTNLQYFIANKQCPVILVTSTMAGEGKTFTSMNLGAVWAVANKRTVILELDLRKPKVSKALGLSAARGISNYMLGDVTMQELPVMVNERLYVVPAGPIPPNPSELLLDPKIDELMAYLRLHFDCIIINFSASGAGQRCPHA